MEAIATIQHFAVDTAFITAIKRNSRALNTRILEEAHSKRVSRNHSLLRHYQYLEIWH